MAKSQTRQDATRTRQKNKLPSPPKGKEEKLFAGEEPLYDSRRGTPWPRSETLGIMDEIGKYIKKAKGYIPSEEERQETAEALIAQYEDAGLNVPPELLSSIGIGELLSMAGESLPTKGEDIETEVLLSMLGGPKPRSSLGLIPRGLRDHPEAINASKWWHMKPQVGNRNWRQGDLFDDGDYKPTPWMFLDPDISHPISNTHTFTGRPRTVYETEPDLDAAQWLRDSEAAEQSRKQTQADMFDDLLAKLFKDESAGTMYPPAVGTDEYEELYNILQKRKALSKSTDPTGKRVGDKNPLRAVLEEESDEMKARRKYPKLWENPNERIR